MSKMLKILLLASVMLPTLKADCPDGCECIISFQTTCDGTNLTAMPTDLDTKMKFLHLPRNEIKSISTEIQLYPDLQYIDLSDNKLKEIKAQTFYGMEWLWTLKLRRNLIDQIEKNSFASLVRLELLDLGMNRIVEIKADVFSGLNELYELHLENNLLSRVPTESLLLLDTLTELYIGGNSFTTVEKAFESFKMLDLLSLEDAQLQEISTGAFAGLENLKKLDLSGNRLTRIPTKELLTLHRLEKLRIGKNDFEAIEAGAFEGLTNLLLLEIVGASKLVRVDNDAFSGNPNLTKIEFSSNKALSQVGPTAFRGLPNLSQLIFENNAIDFSEDRDGWCAPRLLKTYSGRSFC